MTKITQKQLIESLSQLKEIKPRQEWASLLKSQILAEKQADIKTVNNPAKFAGFSNMFFQKKLAYSFAVILLLVVGAFGFIKLLPAGQATKQTAALTGQTGLNQDVAVLSSRINDLATASKDGKTSNIPSAISEIKTNVSQVAKGLKSNSVNDPQTIKEIASSLKTLADVPGTDLSTNSDLQNLSQIVVQSEIADLQKTTLTDDQKKTLVEAQDLYNQGKFTPALEKILLISK